jgi:glycosyltransferase involved in cell wall biosynthesis
LPATTGGELNTLLLLKYLSRKHNVTTFTVDPYSDDYLHQTEQMKFVFGMRFKPSRYINIFVIPKLIKLIKSHQAEWIFFDQPWFGWVLWCLKLLTNKKFFVRANNIEYLRFRSMGKWFWQMLYVYEKWTYKSADLVLFVTENERQKAIYEFDLDPNKTLLTPFGVELDEHSLKINIKEHQQALKKSLGVSDDEKMILFFSTLSYQPNYEAVKYIANNIIPELNTHHTFKYKVVICGKGLPDDIKTRIDSNEHIIHLGFVEDLDLFIDTADVMINPILSGGGIKTKAVSTLGRNQRVISTVTGADGLDASVCGNNLIIVADNDWSAFADAIIQWSNQPKQLPDSFYQKYGWTGIANNVIDKLNSIK